MEFCVIVSPFPEITAMPVFEVPLSVTTFAGPIVFLLPLDLDAVVDRSAHGVVRDRVEVGVDRDVVAAPN